MKVRRAHGVKRDAKALAKKYRSFALDVERFERLLGADYTIGHVPYSDLHLYRDDAPARIFKVRVHCVSLAGNSKSSGSRYVYERIATADGDEYAVCLTIYVHQQNGKESDVQQTLGERFKSFDVTDLDDLESPLDP